MKFPITYSFPVAGCQTLNIILSVNNFNEAMDFQRFFRAVNSLVLTNLKVGLIVFDTPFMAEQFYKKIAYCHKEGFDLTATAQIILTLLEGQQKQKH